MEAAGRLSARREEELVTQQNKAIKVAILKVLQDFEAPAGAARIVRHLSSQGVDLQPRTIRFYLLQMDREGLTKPVSRRMGRELTAKGREELAHANIIEKVGFVASRIDALGYRMTFRNSAGAGTIITNIATIEKGYLARALEDMKPVFGNKLSMGPGWPSRARANSSPASRCRRGW